MQKDPVEEATNVLYSARDRGITLRLLGGVAFRIRCPSTVQEGLTREYADIDFAGLRSQRPEIQKLFTDLTYVPRTTFNAVNGGARLIFNDLENQRRADIFLDNFEMSHKFKFADRLTADEVTLPLADLLLTKLQVYEFTEKEHKDVIALLKDMKVGDADGPDTINMKYIAALCGGDWGLYRTVTLNLDKIRSGLSRYRLKPEEQESVESSINRIRESIESQPKSLSWKLRAKVGEKVRWYELPEQDRGVVDSRPLSERLSFETKKANDH